MNGPKLQIKNSFSKLADSDNKIMVTFQQMHFLNTTSLTKQVRLIHLKAQYFH